MIGGFLDEEFQADTSRLFHDFAAGRLRPVLSSLTIDELLGAPEAVRALLGHEALVGSEIVRLNDEAVALADQYLHHNVVPLNSFVDARHIALATVSRIDTLVSWNFKHIVKLSRIRGFNAVNLMNGYQMLEIRSPKEVYDEEG